jgi:hypothetical protein
VRAPRPVPAQPVLRRRRARAARRPRTRGCRARRRTCRRPATAGRRRTGWIRAWGVDSCGLATRQSSLPERPAAACANARRPARRVVRARPLGCGKPVFCPVAGDRAEVRGRDTGATAFAACRNASDGLLQDVGRDGAGSVPGRDGESLAVGIGVRMRSWHARVSACDGADAALRRRRRSSSNPTPSRPVIRVRSAAEDTRAVVVRIADVLPIRRCDARARPRSLQAGCDYASFERACAERSSAR